MNRSLPWHRYWTALLLVLALATLPGCISAKQWERLRAHSTATIFSTVIGGLAVVIGGPIGLAVAGGAVLGGVAIDHVLEPEPEVVVRTVTTVVQLQPEAADGTQAKPVVRTFVDEDPDKLPDAIDLGKKLGGEQLGWIDRTWKAIKVLGIVLAILVAVGALLLHHWRGVLGFLCYLPGALWRAGAKGAEAIQKLRKKTDADRTP